LAPGKLEDNTAGYGLHVHKATWARVISAASWPAWEYASTCSDWVVLYQ